jgi:WD40 repeat protein
MYAGWWLCTCQPEAHVLLVTLTSPACLLLSACLSRMWDLASGELRGVLDVPGGDSGWVSSLTFPACDATTLVSGASDGYIRWEGVGGGGGWTGGMCVQAEEWVVVRSWYRALSQ